MWRKPSIWATWSPPTKRSKVGKRWAISWSSWHSGAPELLGTRPAMARARRRGVPVGESRTSDDDAPIEREKSGCEPGPPRDFFSPFSPPPSVRNPAFYKAIFGTLFLLSRTFKFVEESIY